MKKLFVLILSVIAAFTAIISLTACDFGPGSGDNGGTNITDGDKSNDKDDSQGGSQGGSLSGEQGGNSGGSQGGSSGGEQGGSSSGEQGGDKTPEHIHTFDKQNTASKYIKKSATCTQKAIYYYSCECGKRGTETFEYGEKLPHTYDRQVAEE